jgi:hypothetical protein
MVILLSLTAHPLRRFARLDLAHLLSFHLAGIALHEAPELERGPVQVRIVRIEGSGNAQSDRPRLTGEAAPLHSRLDVELAARVGHNEREQDLIAVRQPLKVPGERLPVDDDLPKAGLHPHLGMGSLPRATAVRPPPVIDPDLPVHGLGDLDPPSPLLRIGLGLLPDLVLEVLLLRLLVGIALGGVLQILAQRVVVGVVPGEQEHRVDPSSGGAREGVLGLCRPGAWILLAEACHARSPIPNVCVWTLHPKPWLPTTRGRREPARYDHAGILP